MDDTKKEVITQADNLAGPSESEMKHGEGFAATPNKHVTENIPSRTTFVIIFSIWQNSTNKRL